MDINVHHVVSDFLNVSGSYDIRSDLMRTYTSKLQEVFKHITPLLEEFFGLSADQTLETLQKLCHYVDQWKKLFADLDSFSSKLYFAMQIESLVLKIQDFSLGICHVLNSHRDSLSMQLCSLIESSTQRIKNLTDEHGLFTVKGLVQDQLEGLTPRDYDLMATGEGLCLKTNQDILMEVVALERLKENAEQSEDTKEIELIDQMITFAMQMHENLVQIKRSQTSSSVLIPVDFFCPLSLEVMTDPVIVTSGQTYERVFIKQWFKLGLTICPKTRQTLAHNNLTPNYTVKTLIANWCECHDIKLPTGPKTTSFEPSPILVALEPRKLDPSHALETLNINSSQTVSIRSAQLVVSSSEAKQAKDQSRPDSEHTENGYNVDVETQLTVKFDGMRHDNDTSAPLGSPPSPVKSKVDVSNSNSDSPAKTLGDPSPVPETPSNSSKISSPAIVHLSMNPNFPSVESRSRNQATLKRLSDRHLPKIVSSSTETRKDHSGIETQVRKLVDDLKTTSTDTQREATLELRLLAKHNMDNRIVIAECGAIDLLVSLLRSTDTKIQENAVTTLLNLSINDNNKAMIANADAIDPLIHVLKTGSSEAKENSAATLFSLSVINDNKVRIGRSEAIKPLVDLLGNGTQRGKKDAATALFNLSLLSENKTQIVQAGAVKHLIDLMDPATGMVDKAVAVLANLASIPEGRTAIGQEKGIPILVEVVELGSARGKENAAAALLQLCTTSGRFCNMVLQEGAVPPLVALSQTGTPRAKEKAQTLLNYFRSHRHGNTGRS